MKFIVSLQLETVDTTSVLMRVERTIDVAKVRNPVGKDRRKRSPVDGLRFSGASFCACEGDEIFVMLYFENGEREEYDVWCELKVPPFLAVRRMKIKTA